MVLAAIIAVAMEFVPHGSLLGIAGLFLCGFFVFGPASSFWALCPDIFGRRLSGTATGLLNFISYACAGLGEPLIGGFMDHNRIVLKPTELTPLTALALADVLYEAGLPPEMLSIVTGNPNSMGDAMITDPDADLITFTGSVRVGKHIAAKAGYKRLVLELGGNDPLIVMEDADLEKAAELAVLCATKNSGQRCTAVKRILCVEAVADQFAEQVLKRAKKLKCGDPMDPSVDIGTVIHEDAAKEFERRVEAAVQDGARLLHGNNREGALYPPTVVDHVPHTCELILQETFGPVIPIVRTPNDIESVPRSQTLRPSDFRQVSAPIASTTSRVL